MSNVIQLPNARAPKLEDAKPVGGIERTIYVFPGMRGWDVHVSSDGGGAVLGMGLSKSEAIRIAVEWVLKWNCELFLQND
ncbi:hypothetical protein DC522_01325 [Microvirga sp. KLBC 81]|uniref:hypothetical protein n=1 Tax=Microvirga sp. KLBC 81 TaxID=1862707 RepID=UPI000D52207D|nr:hypothetical protein [Microvirga sp. KLBC 81]PVE26432.1 hypothetical protein DC522_01325 [Microvirga sp. KLBC 81]